MENPVLNDDTAGEALRALGAQMDATGEEPSSATPEPDARAGADDLTEKPPTDPKPEGESSDNPDKKPDDQAQKEPKEPAKEPSAYEKAKRREADAWKKINDEKAALQRERDEVARQRQQPQPKPSEKSGPAKDPNGHSADDYEAAAKQFDAEGDTELAKQARAKAADLRQQETVSRESEKQTVEKQKFENDWRSDMEKAIGANPDLAKPGSPVANELSQLLTEEPIFGHIPNGFSKAVQLLNLRREAGQVSGLKETITKHEAEIARLTKLTSINGGGPSAPPAGQKTFDQMSDGEQRTYLEREAARADSYVG